MLAGLSSATAQRSTITRDAFRPRADSLVFTYLAESHAPSASFAVIRGNDTLAYGAHGLANVDAWRAPTATTIYEIGSNTKQFTSAAIMKLVEQGRVKLDDDLSKYVPQFPLHGKQGVDSSAADSHVGHPRLHVVAGVAEDVERRAVARRDHQVRRGRHVRLRARHRIPIQQHRVRAARHGDREGVGTEIRELSRRAVLQAARSAADVVLSVEDVRSRIRARVQQGTERHGARAVPGSVAPIRRRRVVLHGRRLREVAARARRRKGGVARVVRAHVDRRHAQQRAQDQLRLRPRAGGVQRPQDGLAYRRHSGVRDGGGLRARRQPEHRGIHEL